LGKIPGEDLMRKVIVAIIFSSTTIALLAATAITAQSRSLQGPGGPGSIPNFRHHTRAIPAAVLDPNFVEWHPPQPVPVMPCMINDIMATDLVSICINPWVANSVPPKIRAFFLAHEYGHVYSRTVNEITADEFAGRVYSATDMRVVRAMIWYMYHVQGFTCDATHPCGRQRAFIIGNAAGLSQTEIHNIILGAV
jgi:hypothetical protein